MNEGFYKKKKNEEIKNGSVLSELQVITGTFIANPRGFGFVEAEGRKEDLFVPEQMVNGAFHKDKVEAALTVSRESSKGKRQEARVLRVLSHGITQVVGTLDRSRENYGFVIPDDPKISKDIFVPKEAMKGAEDGSKVVVKITDYGGGQKGPEGKITEVLGHMDDPGVDILSIVKGYELPEEFGEKVLNQAQRVAKEVSEADCAGRRDLRDVTMVTIDGEDAKDLDDAVSLSFEDGYYHLGVHIADVSNYVQENSALDREALNRGTSVYLVDRVIPMLPKALSNGICSLNAGEDRLALSCLMTIDGQGEIMDYEICESVIRVDKRMSYTVVKDILEDSPWEDDSLADNPWEDDTLEDNPREDDALEDNSLVTDPPADSARKNNIMEGHARKNAAVAEQGKSYEEYKELVPCFQLMAKLSAILRGRRRQRGAVDFDFPECRITLDGEGRPLEIKAYERNIATDIIEDFMLAANETVAQHFYWMELPFVYRVHDVPDPEKIRKLAAFINNFGYYMKSIGRKGRVGEQDIHPKELQKLLDRIAGTQEEALISRMTLRSMRQAKYSTDCTGHFGLACQYYCHFTSPIRRYPDLQIHRIIKDQLRGRLKEERIAHYEEILPGVCLQSSQMERRADEAERETEKLKKAQYMQEHLGEICEGVISGITSWGVFVELPNTVEGMVPVSKLPGDYYIYREESCELTGVSTGRAYKLGMPVKVCVTGADCALRTVEFEMAEEAETAGEDEPAEEERPAGKDLPAERWYYGEE